MNPKACIYGDHIFSPENPHTWSDRGILGCAVRTLLSIRVLGTLMINEKILEIMTVSKKMFLLARFSSYRRCSTF